MMRRDNCNAEMWKLAAIFLQRARKRYHDARRYRKDDLPEAYLRAFNEANVWHIAGRSITIWLRAGRA